ncbi:type II toxin-antitoxin system VapC family toxin [Sulfitobacter sp. S0837]|uniref:type II toxin-antitoxin system VapC family toxin n=1 Tax=Sulfitobacter maritimus TaxID=2741719 RepID=UPI0015825D10|nr:type II toxin-antitoxin system VapC family toxin [Sulfitobacter maritimus]NUH66503.1 type II toxin-antitoxin system VapC family toxin [Sulfitobacter maritimus]
MTLVDTNVLLDLVTDDPQFADWSIAQLEAASLVGPLLIDDVIYAELSVRYESKEQLDTFIDGIGLKREPIPDAALFLAAKVFRTYRKAGGTRSGVLPDFFIGAHAAVRAVPLLTRDQGRYRSYYPTVELIAPVKDKL